MTFGNGATTQYAYDARNRRLANLQAVTQGRTIQNLAYRYDNVGNILGLNNNVPVPPPNLMGGPTTQSFGYDDLYRLTKASGSWDYAPNKRERYSLAMAYDTIHNITAKTQLHEVVQPGGQAIEQKKTSYDWKYEYGSSHPHAPTHLGERTYKYDANGNQLGWDNDRNGTRRNIVWDDENRIQSVFDNGHEKTYKYDDQGDRVIKRGPQGETAYVNQWFTVRNREVASKHVWAGTTRIATSLVPGVKPVGSAGTVSAATVGVGSRLPPTAQQAPGILAGRGLAQRSAQAAQHARNLEKNPHYAGGGGGGGSSPNVPQENFLYYYHPDHLGSSSYVTDSIGKVFEHLEYFPFGETWVEESSNTQRTPYLFTAKELDEETGLYYFGARYYDPRVSVWQSPDPILGKYLDSNRGKGGIYNSRNLSLYGYVHLNPVRLTDPDGNSVLSVGDWIDFGKDVGSLLVDEIVYTAAVISGNHAVADLALEGMVEKRFDAAASTLGVISPAPRTGTALKAMKAAEHGAEGIKAVQIGKNVEQTAAKVGAIPKPPTGPGTVPKSERDPKRFFTPSERETKRADQGHVCGTGCGTKIDESNSAGHHIKRHADGGRTVPENHSEVCLDCHNKLHSGDKP